MERPVITFLSDFGLNDEYVGTCHGVIARIAPEARVIDITHGVAPQAVLEGAIVLANTLSYMPPAVHLAVVDPGVGSQRRALALRSGEGRLFVGPDNGLLLPAIERHGGIDAAHELFNPEYALPSVSRTFHGRDLFAPAAAHLSLGAHDERLGPPVDPEALVRVELPEPQVGRRLMRATMLGADRFGNIQLNLMRDHFTEVGAAPGTKVEIEVLGERYFAVVARTFADARTGDLILYEDSFRWMGVAISGGSALELFPLSPGGELLIHLPLP